MTGSAFSQIPAAPSDPIFGVQEAFTADTNPNKVNLGVGVYYNEAGKIPILRCVKEAETRWLASEETKSYLPIDGLKEFNQRVAEVVLGLGSAALRDKRALTVQTISGSGALRVAGEFIHRFFPNSELWISDPTWENHRSIYESAGLKVHTYFYYDPETHAVDHVRLLQSLRGIPPGSAVLLHACCHNPTGCDLTRDQWREVVQVIVSGRLLPIVDLAYQGLDSGLDADRSVIDLLVDAGVCFFVANSFSKNFSIYRERVGGLTVVCANSAEMANVHGQLKRVIRSLYSNPPSHGAQVINLILGTPELRTLWEQELAEIRTRLAEMRALLANNLKIVGKDLDFIRGQHGMFSYSGLTAPQVSLLRDKFGLHLLSSGRICIASLNTRNIEYVAQSIAAVS